MSEIPNIPPEGVRIVKLGKLPSEKVYSGKCTNCKTEVEFKRGAANYVPDQRDGDMLQVSCPLCRFLISTSV